MRQALRSRCCSRFVISVCFRSCFCVFQPMNSMCSCTRTAFADQMHSRSRRTSLGVRCSTSASSPTRTSWSRSLPLCARSTACCLPPIVLPVRSAASRSSSPPPPPSHLRSNALLSRLLSTFHVLVSSLDRFAQTVFNFSV